MANELNHKIKPYATPSTARAIFQMINTLIPFGLLVVAMYYMIIFNVPYIFVVLFSIVPALFLVRVFIMFHDCTHKSFLKSTKAMIVLGHIFGILTFTPFFKWQRDHIIHHRSVGNLEKRGIGDVWMMTTDEYEKVSLLRKIKYRLYRNPFLLFFVGPVIMFVIGQRFPTTNTKKVWLSTIITNLGILAIILAVSYTVGFQYYLLIQLPIIYFASVFGVWLFYIQHQYEDVYWEHTMRWKSQDAALEGSSVYKLPVVLEWFTGAIGYHNVHHLNPRVPNYYLKRAFKEVPDLQEGFIVTFLRSFKLAVLCFYDEKKKVMISYRQYRKLSKT
ncbi:fatty acid desaturase [Liberiplasma polymorphum]|uniref:fatty acid desaturase n=1 Tax=Liberiplasma polymorphum TaxID=3374570 RepID=UPI0037724C18